MITDEILARLRERLGPTPEGIVSVNLFSSVARGQARRSSDVDIGVLYEVTPPATLEGTGFDLAAELDLVVGRRIDLVVLNSSRALTRQASASSSWTPAYAALIGRSHWRSRAHGKARRASRDAQCQRTV